MKYKELLNFEPITEVVKFSRTSEIEYQKSLIKTFVFSDTFKNHLIPLVVKNLNFNLTGETFGLQVVGNYGTGKSHLMSLISLVAENEEYVDLITEENPKESLKSIAGKFKVLRFELGNTESLWEVITFKIENYFEEIGIDFSFDGHGPKTYFERLQLMMAEFEEKFPDKGFMIVIDEMLAYLKGRGTSDKLSQDLQVLQALGQACDSSKFKFIFGVQEMIYHAPEFQFAADMLQKVNARFKSISITKEDVAFIVKNRLLKKNEHQKQQIKEHLEKFYILFNDMHVRHFEYIDLFPVHPSYFENFEKIKIGKSQREILKTLSTQFSDLLEKDVPTNNPGLLTYDSYWLDISKDQSMMAERDIRKVKEIVDAIYDKIETYFVDARFSKKTIAHRITNACAIKMLQDSLDKENGTNAEKLVDDLCLTDKIANERELLIDIIKSTAENIITATYGQYFYKNDINSEFHLKIDAAIPIDQIIKDYLTTMSDSQKDDSFYTFLEKNLPIEADIFRTGFKIWPHYLDWQSHKTFRDGYIFFGNPNEKSTTHPRQHFYMYFMPIFDDAKKGRNHEEDEIYFIFDDLSEEFKNAVTLYGAALSLEVRADTSQKAVYKQKIEELNKKARALFDQEYIQITKVDYKGKELPLSGFALPGAGASKEQIFSKVASDVFEDWFNDERPYYPKFTQLNRLLAKDNFDKMIKSAIAKIINPEQSNGDGEGILNGLGLWVPGMLDYSHSPYAKSLLEQLKEKGEGKVLNRDEVIEYIEKSNNLWLSKDFKIEAELQFLVMATLAALGEIEIMLSSGKTINASNLNELKDIQREDFYSFTNIKTPKGFNEAALKTMFIGIVGKDLSKYTKDPSTYTSLGTAANDWAKRAVTILSKIQGGVTFKGIEVISADEASKYRIGITAFSGFCDKLLNYTTEAKIKNFQFTIEEINKILEAKPLIESLEKQQAEIAAFNEDISYLQQCRQYITDESFKQQVTDAINQLATIITENDKTKIEKYKADLTKLKDQYADWYLKMYLKYRISEADNTQKYALLDSDDKTICEVLKEADFLSTAQYSLWLNKVNKLQPADSSVNKQLILTAPYQDFNPIDFHENDVYSVKELKEELNELLKNWEETLKETLEDPMVKKKINLLDSKVAALLEDFKANTIKLSKDNVTAIRNAIIDLHQGLEKFELSIDGLKTTFNKPLTPDEAIDAFKAYIDQVSKGKERDKIRIILK